MNNSIQGEFTCPICGEQKSSDEGKPLGLISHPIDDLIRKKYPAIDAKSPICVGCRNRFRVEYVEDVLAAEKGALSDLEREVMDSLREAELLSKNINAEFDKRRSLGEMIADKMAEFGGSWIFITIFAIILAVWIIFNSSAILQKHFDPYPYILLNLFLSCLAAIQAPIIMMSQNRQEAKDRMRAEHDYQVNLKAEIEIRHLNDKVDQLFSHQWEHLLEIQRIQMDLMEDLSRRGGENEGDKLP